MPMHGRTERKEMTSLGHFSEGPGCGWEEKGAGQWPRVRFWLLLSLYHAWEEKGMNPCFPIT